MIVPLTESASENPWWLNLFFASSVFLLEMILPNHESKGWIGYLKIIGAGILLGELLHGAYKPWPGVGSEYAVPLLILLMAALAAEGGEKRAARSASIFRHGIIAVLGILLLSSVKQITLEKMEAERRSMEILPAILLPLLGKRKSISWKQGTGIILYTVLGGWIISSAAGKGGIYELSRSVKILGSALRFESITAAAMTLGYYALATYVICTGGRGMEEAGDEYRMGTRTCALMAGAWYLTGIRVGGYGLATMLLMIWCVLPLIFPKKLNLV